MLAVRTTSREMILIVPFWSDELEGATEAPILQYYLSFVDLVALLHPAPALLVVEEGLFWKNQIWTCLWQEAWLESWGVPKFFSGRTEYLVPSEVFRGLQQVWFCRWRYAAKVTRGRVYSTWDEPLLWEDSYPKASAMRLHLDAFGRLCSIYCV